VAKAIGAEVRKDYLRKLDRRLAVIFLGESAPVLDPF